MKELWSKGKYAAWGRQNRSLIAESIRTVWNESNKDVTLYSSVLGNTTVISIATALPGKKMKKDDMVMSFILKGYSTEQDNVVEMKSVYIHPGKYTSSLPHLVNAILAIAKAEMKGYTEVLFKVKKKDENIWRQASSLIDAVYTSISLDKETAYQSVFSSVNRLNTVLQHNHRLVNLGFTSFIKLLKKEGVAKEHQPLIKDFINVLISYVISCDESFAHLLSKVDHYESYMTYFTGNKSRELGQGHLPNFDLDLISDEQKTYLTLLLNDITSWAIANSKQD